jgi:hypothetical protein
MRHALGQAAELGAGGDVVVLLGTTALAFGLTVLLFDPEQRFLGRGETPAARRGSEQPGMEAAERTT